MPPENGGYMVAAYVVTAVVLLGYAVLLVRRARRAIARVARADVEVSP
jgi:hypothetical protein